MGCFPLEAFEEALQVVSLILPGDVWFDIRADARAEIEQKY